MDGRTKDDIDKRVQKILKEISAREPPVNVDDVFRHLRIHQDYYDLSDPGLIGEITHKLKIGAFKVADILKKSKLSGLWFPDKSRVVIDRSLPSLKHKWVKAHEAGHAFIPHHREIFLGDIAETLDPDYHDMLESEANYGASALIFLGPRFTAEALDHSISIASIKSLSKTFDNTIATTLRRFVLFSHEKLMVGLVSIAWWDELPTDQTTRCRHFVPSDEFRSKFSMINGPDLLDLLESRYSKRRGGTVGDGSFELKDDNGERHEFRFEAFYNRHYIQTIIVHERKLEALVHTW